MGRKATPQMAPRGACLLAIALVAVAVPAKSVDDVVPEEAMIEPEEAMIEQGSGVAPVAAGLAAGSGASCTDFQPPAPDAQGIDYWYDSNGSYYSCEWYGTNPNYCSFYGSGYGNFGKDADQACCVCGGGVTAGAAEVDSDFGFLLASE